jgi:signal transduction histidine kinase
MLRRFGITGRLIMIGLVGFLALLTLFGVLIYQMRTQEDVIQRAFPLPEQIAAMVVTADALAARSRDDFLRALNNQNISVAISPDLPAEGTTTKRVPLVEAGLQRFTSLANREVRVATETRAMLFAGPDEWITGAPLLIAVELADGNFLVVRTRGVLLARFFGIPSGFMVAALSLIIAAVTLVALARETRPLRNLTAALARFAENAMPSHVPPSGAADVRSLIDTVNHMQDRIGTMVKGRTILAGAISHDLKTYLTRLKLRIEDIPDPREREGAERDLAAMLAVVENAMSIARSGAGTRDREVVDLADIVRTEGARFQAAGPTLAIVATDNVSVMADPVALKRVMANLLENASRYASSIAVSITRTESEALLIVDDNGPGIPPEERDAVFEPFYRLDPARGTETGGSGLGLALCRQIIETHGGTIVIADAPMGGARIEIRLPLSRSHV